MVFFALTGGGTNEWLRFQRNVRVVHSSTQVLLFTGRLVAKELLFNWATTRRQGGR